MHKRCFPLVWIGITLLISIISCQLATLTPPNNIKTGRQTFISAVFGAFPYPTFPVTYSLPSFTYLPSTSYGLVGLNWNSPTLSYSIQYRVYTATQTLTGFTISIQGFILTGTLVTTTLNYISIQENSFIYGPHNYSPFYMKQLLIRGDFVQFRFLQNGKREYTATFQSELANINKLHFVKCFAMLTGLRFYNDPTNVHLPSDGAVFGTECLFDPNIKSFWLKLITHHNLVSSLVLRFHVFAIDIFALQAYHNIIVEHYQMRYIYGSTTDSYPPFNNLNSIGLYGIVSIMTPKLPTFSFNIDYAGVSTFPLTSQNIMQFIYFIDASCPAGSSGISGIFNCFAGFNGCSLATNQVLTLTVNTQKIIVSESHQYLVFSTISLIQVYKHDGTSYLPFITITPSLGGIGLDFSANEDLSVIAIMSTIAGLQVFTYNSNTAQYDILSTFGMLNNAFDNVEIEMSSDGRVIILRTVQFFVAGSISLIERVGETKQLQFFLTYNSITNQYDMLQNNGSSKSKIIADNSKIISVDDQDSFNIKISVKVNQNYQLLYEQTLLTSYTQRPYELFSLWTVNQKGDGNVLALVVYEFSLTSILIYHFETGSNSWIFHSQIKLKALWIDMQGPGAIMKFDKNGNTLIIYNKDDDIGYLVIYQRTSSINEFELIGLQKTNHVSTDNIALEITDKLIAINYGTGNQIQIFYCGAGIISSSPIRNGTSIITRNSNSKTIFFPAGQNRVLSLAEIVILTINCILLTVLILFLTYKLKNKLSTTKDITNPQINGNILYSSELNNTLKTNDSQTNLNATKNTLSFQTIQVKQMDQEMFGQVDSNFIKSQKQKQKQKQKSKQKQNPQIENNLQTIEIRQMNRRKRNLKNISNKQQFMEEMVISQSLSQIKQFNST